GARGCKGGSGGAEGLGQCGPPFRSVRMTTRRDPWRIASAGPSALRADLHPDSVGIEHVKAREIALERLDTTPCEIARGRGLVVTRDPDRKMVHDAGRLFEIERDQIATIPELRVFWGV